jgi:pumilio family protein 6
MAGIKRKSAVSAPAVDTKSKSKKVKVEKSTSKGDSKHAVKPSKKSKKAKEESSDDFEESDTSEQENGFYGFSANEDVEMSDADSSEDAEPMEDVKQNGKALKRKSDEQATDDKKKSKSDSSDSKLAELNGTCSKAPHTLQKLIETQQATREKRMLSKKLLQRNERPRNQMPTLSSARRNCGRSSG